MPKSQNPLIELYLNAIDLTKSSAENLLNGRLDLAKGNLAERSNLLKKIQRNVAYAPLWGSDEKLDQLGIDYILADQQLQNKIDCCCLNQ